MKLAGAAYLVYLGVHALVAAVRGREPDAAGSGTTRRPARAGAFRQGFISDLGNPKMAAFFTSLLPQFGSTDAGPSFWLMLSFGLLFCALTWVWLALYAVALERLGETLRRPRVRRAIEAATGVVLVALGLRLAAEPRPR